MFSYHGLLSILYLYMRNRRNKKEQLLIIPSNPFCYLYVYRFSDPRYRLYLFLRAVEKADRSIDIYCLKCRFKLTKWIYRRHNLWIFDPGYKNLSLQREQDRYRQESSYKLKKDIFKKWDSKNMCQYQFVCRCLIKKLIICVLRLKGALTHSDF